MQARKSRRMRSHEIRPLARTHLKYAGPVRSPPGVQQVILAGADEPLSAVGELQREDAALVKVQLVLVGLRVVQDFDVAALHAGTTSNSNFD